MGWGAAGAFAGVGRTRVREGVRGVRQGQGGHARCAQGMAKGRGEGKAIVKVSEATLVGDYQDSIRELDGEGRKGGAEVARLLHG